MYYLRSVIALFSEHFKITMFLAQFLSRFELWIGRLCIENNEIYGIRISMCIIIHCTLRINILFQNTSFCPYTVTLNIELVFISYRTKYLYVQGGMAEKCIKWKNECVESLMGSCRRIQTPPDYDSKYHIILEKVNLCFTSPNNFLVMSDYYLHWDTGYFTMLYAYSLNAASGSVFDRL